MEVWTNCGEYFVIGIKGGELITLAAGDYIYNTKDQILPKYKDEYLVRYIDSLGFTKCYSDALIAKILLLV